MKQLNDSASKINPRMKYMPQKYQTKDYVGFNTGYINHGFWGCSIACAEGYYSSGLGDAGVPMELAQRMVFILTISYLYRTRKQKFNYILRFGL